MASFDIKKVKVACGDCSLSEICLPAGLDKESLGKLENTVSRSNPIKKGENIFSMGDEFKQLYAIRSGSVKLVNISETGEQQIMGFYLPGELLGLDAIEKDQHKCTAVALETMTYCSFPFSRLEELSQVIPGLQHQMFRLMSKELGNENEMLLSINNKQADQRVASFISNISQRYHALGYSSSEFNLAMSRQEIGNYLGLTIETVSRIISRFQSENIITAERKLITIHDKERLHKICHGI